MALAGSCWCWLALTGSGWLAGGHQAMVTKPYAHACLASGDANRLRLRMFFCNCLKLEAKSHRNDFTAHTRRLVIRQCSPRMVRTYNRTAVATKKRFECTHVMFGDSALCSSVTGKAEKRFHCTHKAFGVMCSKEQKRVQREMLLFHWF